LPRFLALFVLFICATPAWAQSQALVKLNVVATDAKGAPVTDLTAKDIQIREDGGSRPLVFFRFAGGKRAMAQPALNEFVNRPGPPVTVILLDRWNQEEMTMASAWQDVNAALGHLENADRVFIYFLGNHADLVPVQPLPGVETDLRGPPPLPSAALVSKLGETVKSLAGLRDKANIDPVERADKTLQALHIVSRMAAIAGPKNLIWVTHGFPLNVLSITGQWVDYTGPVMDVARLAVRAQVAIYTVDQSAAGAGADPAGMSRQTLELVSAQTGGRWFASGRTADALTAVGNDARGTYRLAYVSPAMEAKKSKDHKLRVESARKGVRLLARASFTGAGANPDPDEMLDDIFTRQSHSPFEATEIGLRVVRTPTPAGVHLETHIDPADVYLGHDGGEFHGSLEVKFALYRDGTLESAPPAIQQDLKLTQAEYDAAAKDGIVISRDVAAPGQMQQVRVMVIDRGIQSLGSVTVPVK
jgi:VWFA-related protein